jgi:hypothetical protein
MKIDFAYFMHIVLDIIVEQSLSPIYTARLLYLYTSITRIGLKIFIPELKICDDYKVHLKIKNKKDYDKKFYNNYIIYLALQSLKIIQKMYPESKVLANAINTIKSEYSKRFMKFMLLNTNLFENINNELNRFYEWRDKDGWKNANEQIKLDNNYKINVNKPINEKDLRNMESWCPLENQNMLGAKWGNVKGLISEGKFKSIEKALEEKFKMVDLVKENRKVLDISINLNDSQKMIAEFWAGIGGSVTPPGFWTMFLYCYFKSHKTKNVKQVDYFYKLSCALFESSLIVWNIKYKCMQCRPIQAIRINFPDDEFNYYFGKCTGNLWKPYQESRLWTPPFPDHISGHSTFSSAGAYVLNKLIGKSLKDIKISTEDLNMLSPIFKDNKSGTHYINNIPLSKGCSNIQESVPSKPMVLNFSSWDEMADDAGISRIYGGIHIQPSNIYGLKTGRSVAKMILNNL